VANSASVGAGSHRHRSFEANRSGSLKKREIRKMLWKFAFDDYSSFFVMTLSLARLKIFGK
jgi:hypothetical protein